MPTDVPVAQESDLEPGRIEIVDTDLVELLRAAGEEA